MRGDSRPGIITRVNGFWKRLSDGIAVNQLWTQLQRETTSSYRLYSRDIELTHQPGERSGRRVRRVVSGLFWAMVMKLSPARRVLFVIALVLLFWPGFNMQYGQAQVEVPNLSFLGALIFLLLLALELADRVTMKRDLEIAKEIQTWLMPSAPPSVRGVEMAFATRPANTVAGDYYDAFLRSSATAAEDGCPPVILAIADVAGKSVPAALLMATLQASLRTLAPICSTVPELVERLNRYACDQNVGGQRFTTAFLAELDPVSRMLTYVNAGHNWPVLLRRNGTLERLQTGGVPLGLMRQARYGCETVALAPGDTLLIFTDGLVEAENDKEEEFGESRMLTTLNAYSGRSAADVLRGLMQAADQFVNSAPQHDDITCFVLQMQKV
jgi:serine phosphatase RsbU (regulator of sigma subunit)